MAWVAAEQLLEQREARRRGLDVGRYAQLALLDVLQKLLVVGTAERRVAHNHLEENGADGPYVRLGVVLLER